MVDLFQSALLASMFAGGPTVGHISGPDLRGLVSETHALTGGDAIITARVKSAHSTLQKMQRKNLAVDDVLDRLGLRLRVASVDECYTFLDRLHERYEPVAGSFDDYIASPKANGYQSLHTAVVVPGLGVTEFQLRTHAMHREAESGAAAHWRYKLTA